MYRRQKRRVSLKCFLAASAVIFIAFVILIPGKEKKESGLCTVGKYKNLEITVSEQKEISAEEVENMMESLCEQTGMAQTEELEQMIFQAFAEERIYESEMEKRQTVLREILKSSTIPENAENPEETLLLSVYEKEGLTLTEEEKSQGVRKLQEVFGAASAEELKKFLSEEEQLRIIKKEKTYEYLLQNNHFVTASSAPQS